jgi:hypothetical protein
MLWGHQVASRPLAILGGHPYFGWKKTSAFQLAMRRIHNNEFKFTIVRNACESRMKGGTCHPEMVIRKSKEIEQPLLI